MPETIKSDSQDFSDMKLYIEGGAADGLKPADFIKKYPQFAKYDRQSLRQSISRLRKAFKKKVEERGTRTCKFYCLCLGSIIVITILFCSIFKIVYVNETYNKIYFIFNSQYTIL